MNQLKKTVLCALIVGIWGLISGFLASCSDESELGGYINGPHYWLFFTDDEELDSDVAEQMTVNSSAQTIELRLKRVKGDNIPMPSRLYVEVAEWNASKQRYEKNSQFNRPVSFYKSYTKNEEGESVVCVELTQNDQDTERRILVLISTDVIVNHGYLAGCVEIYQQPDNSEAKRFSLKAKYKDRIYTTEAETDVNGDIVFLDSEYANLMERLDSMDDIQMLLMGDETIYYYDKEDIVNNQPYEDVRSLKPSNAVGTRADGFENDDPSYLGYFGIYDNDHFKGSNITQGLTNFHYTHNLPNLKVYSMNDKVTSIAVGYNSDDVLVCSVLTIWEDTNFNNEDDNRSKHRVSIIASKNSPKTSVPDLKKVKKIGSSKSWNDCISSLSFHFGYVDRLLLDY